MSLVFTVKTATYDTDEQPEITVVIPTRNISGLPIRNCIKSLELQTLAPSNTIIADYGSTTKKFNELMKDLEDFNCTVYRFITNEIWSLPIARNIGIRRATGKIVVTVDADLILEQDVLNTIVKQYKRDPNMFVVSSVCNLPSDKKLERAQLPRDFKTFRKRCTPRGGFGGVMSAPRSWWHQVRAFDERMKGWGAEDDDMWGRAVRDGRTLLNIQVLALPNTKVYHQWHRRSTPSSHAEWCQVNRMMFKRSKYAIIRNDENWGLWT